MIETHRFPPLLGMAALLILLHQAADLATMLLSADLATPAGRVGQLFAAEARAPAILVADLFLVWALAAGGFSAGLRGLAALHLSVGALLLVLLPWFLLDAGNLASGFVGTTSLGFRILAARTLLLLVLAGIGGLLAGRRLLLAAGELRTEQRPSFGVSTGSRKAASGSEIS
jgi:hypothetical protein